MTAEAMMFVVKVVPIVFGVIAGTRVAKWTKRRNYGIAAGLAVWLVTCVLLVVAAINSPDGRRFNAMLDEYQENEDWL